MKYSEAKKQIESLSSKYSAYKDKYTDYFNVFYKNEEVAYLKTDKRYSVTVWSENNFTKLPFSNKLFMIMSEVAMTPLEERVEEKKYHVRICDGLLGYLNIDTTADKMRVYDVYETYDSYGNCLMKTKFTDKDIEELKRRDDIPLDWKKVKLEPVE